MEARTDAWRHGINHGEKKFLTYFIVDDDADIIAVQSAVLATAGHRVLHSTSGADALSRMEAEPPDCALQTIHARAHKLAGSAATFGFPRVGKIAQELEERCFPMLQEAAPPPTACQTITGLLVTLGKAIENED